MKKITIFILVLVISPLAAHAAVLSLVADHSSTEINQPVRVDVQLDTQGEDANAIQGQVVFPENQLQILNITDGSSPFSFWIQAPAETSSGTISFSGIVPGGFEGAASSVLSIWFLPVAPGPAAISFDDVQLLRNDGQGSSMVVATMPATVVVSTSVASTTPTRPVSLITPDPFVPVISHDPAVYGGKYFLAFSTTDKGSGIAYYEILEIPAGTSMVNSTSQWQIATSPYLLQDQTLSSDIYVRAVDHDGNFIVVEVPAQNPAGNAVARYASDSLVILLVGLLFILLMLAWVLLK